MGSIQGTAPAGASVYLNGPSSMRSQVSRNGAFKFPDLMAGWWILSATMAGFRETVKAVQVSGDTPVDFRLAPLPPLGPGPPAVLTVCEALDRRDSLDHQLVVIVGVFKSGMDETLRLDCPTELISGDVGWPSSIGLTKVDPPPENLRDQIEAKRQEILKSAPPEAPLRPERVVGLYGHFVVLAGLTSAKCCNSQVQTSLPPARLFGVKETDLRVIR